VKPPAQAVKSAPTNSHSLPLSCFALPSAFFIISRSRSFACERNQPLTCVLENRFPPLVFAFLSFSPRQPRVFAQCAHRDALCILFNPYASLRCTCCYVNVCAASTLILKSISPHSTLFADNLKRRVRQRERQRRRLICDSRAKTRVGTHAAGVLIKVCKV
jgi:hypothetical protein